jgi:hypothetical protein
VKFGSAASSIANTTSIAERYDGYAKAVAARWPRTARVLKAMAERYRSEARQEETRAELEEESWSTRRPIRPGGPLVDAKAAKPDVPTSGRPGEGADVDVQRGDRKIARPRKRLKSTGKKAAKGGTSRGHAAGVKRTQVPGTKRPVKAKGKEKTKKSPDQRMSRGRKERKNNSR